MSFSRLSTDNASVGNNHAVIPTRLPTLDGWRALAILAVIVHHIGLQYPSSSWGRITNLGSRGVDLFFGISGLLICYRLLVEEQRTGSVSIRGFYWRRAARILPVWACYLIVLAIIVPSSWKAWWGCVFFYRNYLPFKLDWYNAHFWSLAIEEHFYFGMPLLFLLAGRRRLLAFAAVAGLICAWREVDSHWAITSVGVEMRARSDYRIDALMCGCIAAVLLARYGERLKTFVKPWAVFLAAFLFGIGELLPQPERYIIQAPSVPLALLGAILYPRSIFGRVLAWKPLSVIGAVSYGLYVWQQLLLLHVGAPALVQRLPWNLLLLAAIAAVSYRLVEEPINRWARRSNHPGERLSSGDRHEETSLRHSGGNA